MAYAAEWDLDDRVLDREEVEAVVAHVAALAHAAAEVTCGPRGLQCTFRFAVSAAPDIVSALDPTGQILGEDWYRDLDPPSHGDDGYTVRVDLLGPVDGAMCDDEDAWGLDEEDTDVDDVWDDGDDDDERDLDDDDGALDAAESAGAAGTAGAAGAAGAERCLARLRIEALDNREAWPVAFALAAAVVDRLGGDLRDEIDEELFELQRKVPRVIGPAVALADPPPPPDRDDDDDAYLN